MQNSTKADQYLSFYQASLKMETARFSHTPNIDPVVNEITTSCVAPNEREKGNIMITLETNVPMENKQCL